MSGGPRVGFFVTCLVDALRPSVGLAAIELLEAAGCSVEVPAVQTCCGQPASNAGDLADARALARRVIEAFEPYDYVVCPSGSCTGEIARRYPTLFVDSAVWRERAADLAAKTREILSFLHDVLRAAPRVEYRGRVAYQHACAGLRELGVREQARALFADAPGIEWVELDGSEVCCGFGGTFCLKYPAISDHIVAGKARAIDASGADTLLVPDLGCLWNIAGKLSRLGRTVRCFHPVEVLANRTERAVGEAAR